MEEYSEKTTELKFALKLMIVVHGWTLWACGLVKVTDVFPKYLSGALLCGLWLV